MVRQAPQQSCILKKKKIPSNQRVLNMLECMTKITQQNTETFCVVENVKKKGKIEMILLVEKMVWKGMEMPRKCWQLI